MDHVNNVIDLMVEPIQRYPTLKLIDRAAPGEPTCFSSDPHATQLEARARELTGEFWPESVWTTGIISRAQLNAVVARLESDRQSLRAGMRLLFNNLPSPSITAVVAD